MGPPPSNKKATVKSDSNIMNKLAIAVGVLAVLVAVPEPGTIPGPLVRTNLHTPNTTDLDTPL